MKRRTGAGRQPGERGKIFCGMKSGAGFVEYSAMVERASQLLADLPACDQSCGMPETMLQKLRFALKRIVARGLKSAVKLPTRQ